MKKVRLTEDHIEKLVIKVLEEQVKDGFNQGFHRAIENKEKCSKLDPNKFLNGIVRVAKGNKKIYPKHTSGVDKLDFASAVSQSVKGELVDDIFYIEVNKQPFCKLR